MSSPEGKKSKLPPADKAQRRAGQSLEEEIRGLFTTGIVAQSTTVLLAFGMAAAAWVNWARKNIYAPIVFTIIGVAAAAWACRKISRTLSTRRKLKRERDGKRLVGKILNRLQQRGYWVFHDAAGTPANIDHVVIGPGGVFTVCTKNWCKPSPDAKAHYDGETFALDDFKYDHDPAEQARDQSRYIHFLLTDLIDRYLLFNLGGKKTYVKPLVVLVDWLVEPPPADAVLEVEVLSHKQLAEYLATQDELLVTEEVEQLALLLGHELKRQDELKD